MVTNVVRDVILEQLAKKELRLETLKTRNSNSLDFVELHVEEIKHALEAAFEAGRLHG